MDIEIIQDLIPKGRHNRPGHPMTPEYITVHSTANRGYQANARMHGIYLRGNVAANRPASWHFTVDDREVRQHLPLDENGWHAGDGAEGPGNRSSIAVEICENSDGDPDRAIARAALLVAWLRLNVPSARLVVQHAKWTGKRCPGLLMSDPGQWQRFLDHVDRLIEQANRPSPPPPKVLQVPVFLPGDVQITGELRDGAMWVPMRPYGEALDAHVQWVPPEQGGPRVNVRRAG